VVGTTEKGDVTLLERPLVDRDVSKVLLVNNWHADLWIHLLDALPATLKLPVEESRLPPKTMLLDAMFVLRLA